MACNGCGHSCIPISLECLCLYAPLSFISDLSLFGFIVEDVNDSIRCLLSDECYEAICKQENNTIRNSKLYKKLWAKNFYLYWSIHNGLGKVSAEGFLVKNSDEYGGYRQISQAQYNGRIKNIREGIEACKKEFLGYLLSNHSQCCKTPPVKKNCGCKNPCGCGNSNFNGDYQSDDLDFI